MKGSIVHADGTVVLVGGGCCDDSLLRTACDGADAVVAADGGAAHLIRLGIEPTAVIGDMDSLAPDLRAQLPPGIVHEIAEQNSTDFDKCLRSIMAPEVLGFGFLGARMDHALAALTVLALRADRRCVLVGEDDVMAICPPDLSLDLPPDCRVSLWPLGPVTGRSHGLRWPIDGLSFRPDTLVGTSNAATGRVQLQMDAPGMVIILPVAYLSELRRALGQNREAWPARV